MGKLFYLPNWYLNNSVVPEVYKIGICCGKLFSTVEPDGYFSCCSSSFLGIYLFACAELSCFSHFVPQSAWLYCRICSSGLLHLQPSCHQKISIQYEHRTELFLSKFCSKGFLGKPGPWHIKCKKRICLVLLYRQE
jgi:hypothetical protein